VTILLILTSISLLAVFLQMSIKSLVRHHSTQIVLRLAPFMQFLIYGSWPFLQLLRQLNERLKQQLSRRLSLDIGSQLTTLPPERSDSPVNENILLTEQGLRQLVTIRAEKETVIESEKTMIARILDLDQIAVTSVMVPRMDMVTVSIDTTLTDALDVIIAAGHSRIPVYENTLDQIVGVLYAKDVLRLFQQGLTTELIPGSIRTMIRSPYFVPSSKKVNRLLRDMQQERVHLALIVDEYGGTAGLVTIEDLIEQIVGDIQDEYDTDEDALLEKIGHDTYIVNARYDLDSVSKLLQITFPESNADTLGGFLYRQLGHVPEEGEATVYEQWRFRIRSLDGHRIEDVHIERLPEMVYSEHIEETTNASQQFVPNGLSFFAENESNLPRLVPFLNWKI
ncbi:MAG: hemolysin family protein, partial [Chloroflexota bacterium]